MELLNMKKLLPFLIALLLPISAFAQSTVQQGGTGLNSVAKNNVLLGNSALHLTSVATSSLGLESPLTFSSPLSRTGNAISFLFNTTNIWTGLNTFQNGFVSQASSTAIHLHLTGLATPAGTFIAVDPNGEIIATTSPSSGGSGTVTNIGTTYPIKGGPITTTGTISVDFGTTTSNTWAGTQTFTNAPVFSSILNGLLATNNSGTVIATTTPTALFFNASSATATSTFAGNVRVVGNLQVLGNVYATVQLITSGNATINGTLNVTGATTLATSLNGAITAASGVLSAGTLTVSNGGTGQSTFIASQLLYGNGTTALSSVATTTANFSTAFSTSTVLGYLVGGTNGVVSSIIQPSFTVTGTTTAPGTFNTLFGATTTIPLQQLILPETIQGVSCRTDGGTANVQFGNGSASTSLINASTTANFNAYTTNNTPTIGQQFSVDVGTFSGPVTKINCTVKIKI